MLVVLAPLALLALILWVATRRAKAMGFDEDEDPAADDVVHREDLG